MSEANKGLSVNKPFSRLIPICLVFVFYFALSLFIFGSSSSWFDFYSGEGPDPITFTWFLKWWPFAIQHGLDPFHSDYAWYPQGYNMTWATSVPTLAILASPVTQTFGPLLTYNCLSVFAPALSALTAYLLANEIVKNRYIAFVSGFLFGFSSCETAHLLGDLNLATTFLVPLAPLLCILHVRLRIRKGTFIFAMAATTSAQLGISTELLATCCIFGAIAWLIFLFLTPKNERAPQYNLVKDLALSVPISLALSSVFLYTFFSGGNQFPGSFFSAEYYEADLANFVIPTAVTFLGHGIFSNLSNSFTGNLLEQGAYLGVPLILIVISFFLNDFKNPNVRALFWCTILSVILSLGPTLQIAGHKTNMTLPWRFIQSIPLIRMALPARMCLFTSLCTSLIVAIWISKGNSNRSTAFRFGLALLACATILPDRASHRWTRWPQDAFFSPEHAREVLGSYPNVIILPFFDSGPGIAWQLEAGMQFKQAIAYVGYPPRQEQSLLLFRELLDGTPALTFGNDFSIYCLNHKVNYILVGPHTSNALVTAIQLLKWPQHLDGDMTVVQVPQLKNLTYGYIQGNYWPSLSAFNFAGKQFTVLTNGAPYFLTISGQDRPPNITTRFTITNQFGSTQYTVTDKTVLNIKLSVSGTTTAVADTTFVPDNFFHNGDQRNLSAMISIGPVPKNQ
jgi:hypothetical protein